MEINDLTIIIPTFNRSDFLYRTLEFYDRCNFNCKFIIGDSSNEKLHIENNIEICDRLNVEYYHNLNLPIADTIKLLNNKINTKYVLLLPDDDLYMPEGIMQTIKFLNNNEEYIGANGKCAIFMLNKPGAYGKIRDLGDYNMKGVSGNTPSERIIEYSNNGSVLLFSTFRREQWIKMWDHAGKTNEVGMNAEIIPCNVAVALGKIKNLNCVFMLRQEHNRRIIQNSGTKLLLSNEYKLAKNTFIETLSQYVDRNIVNDILSKYNYRLTLNKPDKKKLNIEILKFLKIIYLNTKREVSLPKLRNKNIYNLNYQDFMIFENLLKNK